MKTLKPWENIKGEREKKIAHLLVLYTIEIDNATNTQIIWEFRTHFGFYLKFLGEWMRN